MSSTTTDPYPLSKLLGTRFLDPDPPALSVVQDDLECDEPVRADHARIIFNRRKLALIGDSMQVPRNGMPRS